MPLVAAGLPVLQPLHVGEHREPASRVDAVLVEQRRDLGDGGVLELVQAGREQVVDRLGGLLGGDAEELLQHQHAVAQLALVEHLALVGEQVVAQVHGVGEGVAQHADRPRQRDARRDLHAGDVLDEVGRPRRATHLAAHLDVLDRVGQAALGDVQQLPHRLVEQVLGVVGEPAPPVGRVGRDGALPEVLEALLDRVGRLLGDRAVDRHEQRQPVEVRLRARDVGVALVELDEVVVEVEDPHVPVGDQVEVVR
ncbi:hypothetical protein GCM10018963_14610 [Saccharothrix longispora]